MAGTSRPHAVVIGAGFCGLAAAYELGKHGIRATVLERDAEIGGLAGSFRVNGVRLEKFYHHWFTNDVHVMQLIEELGNEDQILLRPTRTGMYYANNFFKLSTPSTCCVFRPCLSSIVFALGCWRCAPDGSKTGGRSRTARAAELAPRDGWRARLSSGVGTAPAREVR